MTQLKITSDDGKYWAYVSKENLHKQIMEQGEGYSSLAELSYNKKLKNFKQAIINHFVKHEDWKEDRALWHIEKAEQAMDTAMDTVCTPISFPVEDKPKMSEVKYCTNCKYNGDIATTCYNNGKVAQNCNMWELKVPEKIDNKELFEGGDHYLASKIDQIITYLEAHNKEVR